MAEKVEVRSYRDLLVWQKGIELVKRVYAITAGFPHHEIYALTSQIRRAAISIPSNIAEGQARQHTGEFRQFLHIALGSLAEVETQLCIASELQNISEQDRASLHGQIIELQKMLNTLIVRLPKS